MKENQHIEWKESWRDDYLKWVCGFANAEGGVLVIGRNDNAFFRAGAIEAWGQGIERILDTCKAAQIPEPIFRSEQTGLWLEFPFLKVHEEITTQETTQEKILTLLKATPTMTRKQISERIKISEDGVKYHINKMKSTGLLRHVGSTKAGYWEVLK